MGSAFWAGFSFFFSNSLQNKVKKNIDESVMLTHCLLHTVVNSTLQLYYFFIFIFLQVCSQQDPCCFFFFLQEPTSRSN